MVPLVLREEKVSLAAVKTEAFAISGRPAR